MDPTRICQQVAHHRDTENTEDSFGLYPCWLLSDDGLFWPIRLRAPSPQFSPCPPCLGGDKSLLKPSTNLSQPPRPMPLQYTFVSYPLAQNQAQIESVASIQGLVATVALQRPRKHEGTKERNKKGCPNCSAQKVLAFLFSGVFRVFVLSCFRSSPCKVATDSPNPPQIPNLKSEMQNPPAFPLPRAVHALLYLQISVGDGAGLYRPVQ